MNIHDQINSIFEFCAIFMILNHCYVLYKDKKVRGVSVLSSIFFTTWSFWNTYYYPNINQMWSFLRLCLRGIGAMFLRVVDISLPSPGKNEAWFIADCKTLKNKG